MQIYQIKSKKKSLQLAMIITIYFSCVRKLERYMESSISTTTCSILVVAILASIIRR